MYSKGFPVIDMIATGDNIKRLRVERGLTVRDLQRYFGFEEPQAIYKWQRGQSLPTVDNLYALGNLFELPMDEILVPATSQLHMVGEQRGVPCCSILYFGAVAQKGPIKGLLLLPYLWYTQKKVYLMRWFRCLYATES